MHTPILFNGGDKLSSVSRTVESLLLDCVSIGASDLHLNVGYVPMVRVDGKLLSISDGVITSDEMDRFIRSMCISNVAMGLLMDNNTTDFTHVSPVSGRFRVNVSVCMGGVGKKVSFRPIRSNIPTPTELGFSRELISEVGRIKNGMILFCGPTGSGKSTSMASLLKYTSPSGSHILTLENPIEYILEIDSCLVTQRELGVDFKDFPTAISTAMRQDPDTILVGEMRDVVTAEAGIMSAETGHLVYSTLHAVGVDGAFNRLTNIFSDDRLNFMRTIIGDVVRLIVAQSLEYDASLGRRVLKYEYKVF